MALLRFQVKMKVIFVIFFLSFLSLSLPPSLSEQIPSHLPPTTLPPSLSPPNRPATNHWVHPHHQPSSVLSTIVFILTNSNRSDLQTGPITIQIFQPLSFSSPPTTIILSFTSTTYWNSDLLPKKIFEWSHENTVWERSLVRSDEWSSLRSNEWFSMRELQRREW